MSPAVLHARSRRRRRSVAVLLAVATTATTAAGSVALLGAGAGGASSHREAPLTAGDPAIDNTDTYAFVSPDEPDTVTLIANWIPFQEPNGGPNFFPWSPDAHYDINIDNNGDAKADITYRWTFTSNYKSKDTFLYNTGPVTSLDAPTLNFTQTYKLEKINGEGTATTLIEDGVAAPDNVGRASMPDYASLRDEAVTDLPDGEKTFVGQADDSFFLDLRVFDLLYGGDLSEVGQDTLDGYNVKTIAIQVPKSELVADGEPVIGVWSDTERPGMQVRAADGSSKFSGDFVQVSRLGAPLVNELVIPVGLKDAFNALKPEQDRTVAAAVARVNDPEVPKLIEKIYGLPAPKAPREDIFAAFLTGIKGLNQPKNVVPAEMLRLNTSIAPSSNPSRLGALVKDNAGFPNGRRLADDVVDIELQALAGALRTGKIVPALAAGDGVDSNDVEFGSSFPYVALPHFAAVNGGVSGGSSPQGSVGAGGGGAAGQLLDPSAEQAPAGSAEAADKSATVAAPRPSEPGLPLLPVGAAVLGIALAGLGVRALRHGPAAVGGTPAADAGELH